MAENKKSFILYADLIKSIDHLTNEEIGILFRHLFDYVNDKDPILTDRLLLTAWKPIELQLKRDLGKWDEIKETKSESGILGNLKRWHKDLYDIFMTGEITLQDAANIAKHRKTSHSDRTVSQEVANIAVNVTDTVTVNDNVIVNEIDSKEATPPPPHKPIKKTISIEERKTEFINRVFHYANLYGDDLINAFTDYWTEKTSDSPAAKMLFETKKAFEINLRLARWAKNDKNFNNKPVPVRKINEIGSNYDVTPKGDWDIGMTFKNEKIN